MAKLLIGSIILLFASSGFALNDESYANGWYWGFDQKLERSNNEQKSKQVVTTISPGTSNTKVLNEIKSEVEELKAKAILTPTVDNVTNYIRVQNKATNLASGFSLAWEKALLAHPELNYTAQNPTNNYARQVLNEQQFININAAVKEFSNAHGLLFFFNGRDKISSFQSKIIKSVVNKHNIAVIPIAVDNTPNQYFTNIAPNNDRSQKLGITVIPAIVALNVRTHETAPLAFGVTTEYELEEKIYNYLTKDNHNE